MITIRAIAKMFVLVINPNPVKIPRRAIVHFDLSFSLSISLIKSQIDIVLNNITKLSLFKEPLRKLNCGLNAQIDASGSGSFTTTLDPKPSHSWTANAGYTKDGTPTSDSGSGTTAHTFLHSWMNSFQGSGSYSIN